MSRSRTTCTESLTSRWASSSLRQESQRQRVGQGQETSKPWPSPCRSSAAMVTPGGRSTSMVTVAMAVPDKRAEHDPGPTRKRLLPRTVASRSRPRKPHETRGSYFTPEEPDFSSFSLDSTIFAREPPGSFGHQESAPEGRKAPCFRSLLP